MESLGAKARNDSKGCGGLTRVAPAGLFAWHFRDRQEPGEAFALGADLAALTHGHPTGFLPGGVLAVLIQGLAEGRSLPQALEEALACLRARPDHRETLEALERARALASSGPSPEALESLGQ
jgi:ADP-ribosylglycohydrolase